ncbi:hypothetical protein RJ640_025540 [Escallonia rubra]|uniref:Uncharacterized protein n=1 Tax=Escallonia rubra TaxID=112253 RepID=A0AA88U673_9ASTE|nr:hypothetical protein RJ640_025540 [Escallonia rubra]
MERLNQREERRKIDATMAFLNQIVEKPSIADRSQDSTDMVCQSKKLLFSRMIYVSFEDDSDPETKILLKRVCFLLTTYTAKLDSFGDALVCAKKDVSFFKDLHVLPSGKIVKYPWTLPRVSLHTPKSFPDNTIALETRTKTNLQNAVTASNPRVCFQVRQFIPNTTTRSIPKSFQSFPRGLHAFVRKLQVLLYLVEHFLARCQYTKVLKRELVVWNVRLGLAVSLFVEKQIFEEMELFGNRENKRAEGGYVGLKCMTSHLNHILAH